MSKKFKDSFKKNKKELDKEFEKLNTLAEGSVSQAKEILRDEELESKIKQDIVLERLSDGAKGSFHTYYSLLADLLKQRILFVVEFPPGWTFEVASTDKGVIIELYGKIDNKTHIYRQAFKPSGIAKYDLNAIETNVMRIENTIYKKTHS